MSRDKGGAAAAAGVRATVTRLQPRGVKVVAALAMVRNSVGSGNTPLSLVRLILTRTVIGQTPM